jgi:hypothetical protein
MAFIEITSAEITAGEPTSQALFQKIKDNDDDINSRMGVVELAINTFAPIRFSVTNYSALTPATEVDIERVHFDMTLLGARLLVVDAGTSGTLEIDIEYKRGGGSWSTIFSTKPSVVYSLGNYALSTNAVFSVTDLLSGDLLRLNINTPQVNNRQFILLLEYERA